MRRIGAPNKFDLHFNDLLFTLFKVVYTGKARHEILGWPCNRANSNILPLNHLSYAQVYALNLDQTCFY